MTSVPDRRLIARLETLAARERVTTLSVLLHLNEVERRGLHLSLGHGSMFDLATHRLGYSASAAGRRIQAARCIRKHPEIVPLLRRNEVNLSSIGIIGRVLTAENAATLLDAIRGKSQREVEVLAATYGPRIRIPDRVRPVALEAPGGGGRRPEGQGAGAPGLFESRPASASAGEESNEKGTRFGGKTETGTPTAGECSPGNAGERASAPGAEDMAQPEAEPEAKFRVQFAAGPEFVRKLEAVRALLSARFPKGASFEEALEATLDSFLERHGPDARNARRERRRARARNGERARPTGDPERTEKRSANRAPRPTRSHHVSAAIRDTVHVRDGGRCTYVGADGRRCGSTHHLQVDHVTPFGRGGPSTYGNFRLLCAAHNQLEAERVYGSDWMRRMRGGAAPRAADVRRSRIGSVVQRE